LRQLSYIGGLSETLAVADRWTAMSGKVWINHVGSQQGVGRVKQLNNVTN